MSIPPHLIEQLHARLNNALLEFNNLSGCVDGKKRFPLCDLDPYFEMFDNAEKYLEKWVKRIYNTLKARLPPPLYPIVKLEYDYDDGFVLFICYATPSDTPYITSIEDCIEE